MLLRYVGKDSEEAQHPDRFPRAIVKLIPAIDRGGVVPSERPSAVVEDTADEMTVNVVVFVQGDGFIRTGLIPDIQKGHNFTTLKER